LFDGGPNRGCLGGVEIIAGTLAALKPRIGAYDVRLVGIVINQLMMRGFCDIALRNFGLALGAMVLGRWSQEFGESETV
jgi:hypothetical protein